ncbi:MAG: AtpZ/AtpI family protein [Alphaproteobacteria bacterium]|nr:AtpZ/AtpI family protein [Alphaproteobacteria bacterium]
MAESGNGDDKALQARLEKLSGALEAQRREAEREARERSQGPGGETGRAMSLGLRVLTEFVAGVVAGGVLGWLLDKWLSTSPWFLLIFGAFGTAAGFLNVYRIAAKPTSPPPQQDENR